MRKRTAARSMAAVVGAAVHVAGLRPTGEHDRTAGFEDGA